MKTIHLIFQAHLDPIWLWPWTAGADAVLATCRNACDRLDAHPDLYFTFGEAWPLDLVERLDRPLFERIRDLVAEGRWDLSGGWWIQPDCNLPGAEGLRRTMQLGKAFLSDRFGVSPDVAFNADSFGHAASIPSLLRENGQRFYVMMRPQEHEMALPARLFRWRGSEDDDPVTTFRIAGSYNSTFGMTRAHIEQSLTELPEGVDDTMCFVGVGDHGGGPTEDHIRWLRDHADAFPGVRLLFSTIPKYFDAVADRLDSIPLVTGEMQMHAVGCYSVLRTMKTELVRAEHQLQQAERVRHLDPDPEARSADDLREGWKKLSFHCFHDTLGGTCLPSAYRAVFDDIGHANAVAGEIIERGIRRVAADVPDSPSQQVVLFNLNDQPFEGVVEFEPWTEWMEWKPSWRLLDETGASLPYQSMQSEAVVEGMTRIAVPVSIGADDRRILRIERSERVGETAATAEPMGEFRGDAIANNRGFGVRLHDNEGLFFGDTRLPLPELHALPDHSDTWSHGIDRYAEGPAETPIWNRPAGVDCGPVFHSLLRTGTVAGGRLQQEYRVVRGGAYVECRLRVEWRSRRTVLKLVWPVYERLVRSVAGIPGDAFEREPDGCERPLRDWVCASGDDGRRVAIVCPNVYAFDAAPHRIRLTLLRSCLLAHHEPHRGDVPRPVYSDRGSHEFVFRFYAGDGADPDALERDSLALHRPPRLVEITRGMPAERKAGT